MLLYTCNRSTPAILATLLPLLAGNDSLLLFEDGVYAAVDTPSLRETLAGLPAGIRLHVLGEDLAARGISGIIHPGFSRVDYAAFVALTLEHVRVVNWN